MEITCAPVALEAIIPVLYIPPAIASWSCFSASPSNVLELEDFEGLLLSMLQKGHKDVFQNLEEIRT